jgi:hypothetical protein
MKKIELADVLVTSVLVHSFVVGFTLASSFSVGFLLAFKAYKEFEKNKLEQQEKRLKDVSSYEERIKSLESRISALGMIRKV